MPLPFIIDAWSFAEGSAKPLDDRSQWCENAWFHCQRDDPALESWLLQQGFLSGVVNAALAEDTRPRFQQIDHETFVLILRGVNLNEGQAPDDMLSLRVLFYKNSIITFRKRPFKAVTAVRNALANGQGPNSLGGLLIAIIEQLHLRIDDVVNRAEESIESLHEESNRLSQDRHRELTLMHRQLLKLNRFLKPQTFALSELCNSRIRFFEDEALSLHFHNQRDVIFRVVENIEALLDQVWILRELVQQALSETMNRNTYRLSVVAGVFLPLGFVTGLLGVNVGGIPGTDSPVAFYLLCAVLLLLGVVEFVLLRRLRFW